MRRGKRLPPNHIPPAHPGIAVWAERSMITGRSVWVARFHDSAGWSSDDPLLAVKEAIGRAMGKGEQEADDGTEDL